MSSLQKTLSIIREKSNNDSEMGFAFEKLAKVFFENDATQTQQYSKVWHFSDWAKGKEGYSKVDIGIDLVAKLKEEDGYCAIQCKFYKPSHSISKADLDSFISASSTSDFTRLVLIDTSSQPIGKNAQKVFDNLTKEYVRIQFSEIDQSRIDWLSYIENGSINLAKKKELRDHQIKALNDVKEGLKKEDRGKMIMACGTGKTFTSLRIAEELGGSGKIILYMVPSLALMSQTIREWKNDAKEEFLAFSVCSDQKVGKKKTSDDQIKINLNDLAFPATTDAHKLSEKIKSTDNSKMKVIFSTYQSIDVISKSQYEFDLKEFDLVICDEAHRTTGATLVGDDESNFVRIHKNENIKGKKRLYMTATPRIYGEIAKRREEEGEVSLASMDDESIFGKTLFYRSFGWAVENNLLTDYKVVVLMMDEQFVSNRIQQSLSEGSELELDDATKMIGCYKALAKIGIKTSNLPGIIEDTKPMKKALAFCQNIRTSELFSSEFSSVVENYEANENITQENKTNLKVELFHVDGTFNAEQRNEKLDWLKDETEENICRVLTNARCLSEGVDVPSLDAIMFLHPRRSQIDVVQSVGRVMRKSEGKKIGYVILPITVAPGVSAEKALNDNERYEVVWQILNALRAHDERFNSSINRIRLGEDVSDRIEIIDGTKYPELEATTAVIDDIRPKPTGERGNADENNTNLGEENGNESNTNKEDEQLSFTLTDLSEAIKAKIVEKCGTRDYWEKWASDIANIAQKHITRINSIVLNSGTTERDSFLKFVEEIRDDLNPEITENDAVEMLAQHIITRPVFDTLFQGNRFTSENAVSKAMEHVLSQIHETQIDTETRTLKRFYESVKTRADGISTSRGRQQLILELYERFFQNAFPLMTKRLGIVYTPAEAVDFIIHSIEYLMQNEFGSSLSNDEVHILDPFTGTGTFISRLLQSGIFSKAEIIKKIKSEIHANEIVLLAYYIASINIEAVYDDLIKANEYKSFNGIVLTDTFQLYEQEKDMIANLLPDNSKRRTNQKDKNITVILGNPPYSTGQSSANDNAANVKYPNLDKRIEESYALFSKGTNKNSIYDSYIKAFRWASDRLNKKGVIGFITNAGWIDGTAMDGVRKSFEKEFDKIYIFHLRGNARTSGELRRKEKDNIFGVGTRTPVAITLLVKNQNLNKNCEIFFYDIGDYLTKKEKFNKISNLKSIQAIISKNLFNKIDPNEDGDWINQGDRTFKQHIIIGNKKNKEEISIFKNYSNGLKTNRDAWCYNASKIKLKKNINNSLNFFNANIQEKNYKINNKKISWSSGLIDDFKNKKKKEFSENNIFSSLYRPFDDTNFVYFHRSYNERVYQLPKIFPTSKHENLVIVVTAVGAKKEFSCLMTNKLPDNQLLDNCQCFPLYLYHETNNADQTFFNTLFQSDRESGITDEGKKYFQNYFPQKNVSDEDIFYYIYALLHSKQYRNQYKNNLNKELARIPICKDWQIFKTYIETGRQLGDIHVNFHDAEKYPITFKEGDLRLLYIKDRSEFFKVKELKFTNKNNKTVIKYNNNLTIEGIPSEAYNYQINGKSAIEWIIDRYSIKKDSSSGITNDVNDYVMENNKNPEYILEMIQKTISISLNTIKLVDSLPEFDFH